MEEKKIRHLSFSQLQLYQKCPFKYYLKYVKGVKEGAEPIEYSIGGGFHSGLQEMYIKNDFEAGKEVFRKEVMDLGSRSDVDNLTRNLSLYSNLYLPKYQSQMVGTEIKFELNIPKVDVPIIGYIDLLLRNGFVDYKTTSKRDMGESYDIKQLAIYGLWFYSKYRILPEVCEIHYFNKTKVGEGAIGVVRVNVTFNMINVVMLEFQQMWQDIQNKRWTPNLAAWTPKDEYYHLMIEYVESQIS